METCIVCKQRSFINLVNSKDFCVSHEDFSISKCSNCGFAYTDNAPNSDEIGRYYEHEDYVSHTDTKKGTFFSVYHRVRRFMLGQKMAYIKKNAHGLKRSLDIGAGTGYFVNHLKNNGIDSVGFEPDEGARKQAKKNFNLDLISSIDDIITQEDKFDAISMWHVLEHVHDLELYFEHFQKLLNKDGVLAIAVPNYTSFDAEFYKKYWAAYDLPKHLWHFSPDSLKQLATGNAFKHVQSYAMPFDPFYIALLSEGHMKSGWFGKLRALFIGKISFLKGLFNSESASSVVYVFRKN